MFTHNIILYFTERSSKMYFCGNFCNSLEIGVLIETKAAPQDKLCNQKHQNILLNIFGVLELSCRLCKFTVALLQMSFSFLFGGVLCVFVIFEGLLGVFFLRLLQQRHEISWKRMVGRSRRTTGTVTELLVDLLSSM